MITGFTPYAPHLIQHPYARSALWNPFRARLASVCEYLQIPTIVASSAVRLPIDIIAGWENIVSLYLSWLHPHPHPLPLPLPILIQRITLPLHPEIADGQD